MTSGNVKKQLLKANRGCRSYTQEQLRKLSIICIQKHRIQHHEDRELNQKKTRQETKTADKKKKLKKGRKQCARKKTSQKLRCSSAGHELPAGKAQRLLWELTHSSGQPQALLELPFQVFVQLQRGFGRSCRNCWTERRFKSVCSRADWQGGMGQCVENLWREGWFPAAESS